MSDQVETVTLDSIEDMSNLKSARVGEKIVTVDIRNITVKVGLTLSKFYKQ